MNNGSRVIIDTIRGEARIGNQVIPVTASGTDGSLQVGVDVGPILRPLTFGERTRLVSRAVFTSRPQDKVCAGILRMATVQAGEANRAVQEILALALAGADLEEAPSFSRTALLVARASGWDAVQMANANAIEIDYIAMHLSDRPRPSQWNRLVLSNNPDDELTLIRSELADTLLARLDDTLSEPSFTEDLSETQLHNGTSARSDVRLSSSSYETQGVIYQAANFEPDLSTAIPRAKKQAPPSSTDGSLAKSREDSTPGEQKRSRGRPDPHYDTTKFTKRGIAGERLKAADMDSFESLYFEPLIPSASSNAMTPRLHRNVLETETHTLFSTLQRSVKGDSKIHGNPARNLGSNGLVSTANADSLTTSETSSLQGRYDTITDLADAFGQLLHEEADMRGIER